VGSDVRRFSAHDRSSRSPSFLPPSLLPSPPVHLGARTLYCVCMTQSLPTTRRRAMINGSFSARACSNSFRASRRSTSRQGSPSSLGQ
jgi:hypothetical protein